jgi:pantoate--beta-alanine ligase
MKTLKSLSEFQEFQKTLSGSIGFVPTMGALHEGHGELLKKCSSENENTILSIFVNPTQFNDPSDLAKYPRTLEADSQLAKQFGATALWTPQESELYPDGYRFRLTENDLSNKLCGAHRPGHFDGVLTVVMKLLQIVKPHKAYFGEKDFQQLLLIQQMSAAFFLSSQIIPVPTVRAADGLALSSRNQRLDAAQRELAPKIYQIIKTAKSAREAQEQLTAAGFQVDYVEEYENRRFAAAFLGKVRLIDNVQI